VKPLSLLALAVRTAAKPRFTIATDCKCPGHVSAVWPDGTFQSTAELQALFDSLSVIANKHILTYCVRGGLSMHTWFVLTQLLGYPNVREYDRSWAEWGNSEGVSIEQ
jgi:thiosulfate/3-mercaptopyruvate sulfurtransferase